VKIFYNKSRYGIVMMVVLAMLLQIIGPVAESVHAQSDTIRLVDGNFAIEAHKTEKGKATVSWEYVYKPGEKTEYELNLGSIFEQYKEKSGVLIADEGQIGEYTISQDGVITINIDEDIETIVRELQGEVEIPKEPEVPEVPVVPEDDTNIDGTDAIEGEEDTDDSEVVDEGEEDTDDSEVVDEGEDNEELEDGETEEIIDDSTTGTEEPTTEESVETGRIGEPLVSLASIEDIEGLYLGDDDNYDESYTFEGSFEVEGVVVEVEQPKAMTFTAGTDLGDIFTDVTFRVNTKGSDNDDDYEEILVDTNTRFEVTGDTGVRLDYKWEVADGINNLQDGDYATIKMPDVFSGRLGAMSGKLIGTVDGVPGIEVGTYEIDNSNNLKVIFNHELVGKEERAGEVWVYMQFNQSEIDDNANQIIKFEGSINKEFEITAIPGGGASAISKSGHPDKDVNAGYVNWTIDVNTKLEELGDASVEDTIPEGLEFVAESMQIYDLIIGADGNVKSETPSTRTATAFPVNLGEISSAYRIKYKTKILDHSKSSYENIATLKDGTETIDTGKWDIGKLELGSTIEKRGIANNGGTNSDKITWTIDVNKAQLDLQNVTVNDNFTETTGHTLNISNIRIYRIDEYGRLQSGDIASQFGSPTSFPITLNRLENQAYRIEYDTDIEYDEYRITNKFTNSAVLNINGTQMGKPVTDTVTVTRLTLIEKNGEEKTSYGQPYIEWTLHINKAKHNINGATVTDIIGNGLKLVKDSIKIYVGDSNIEYNGANITEKEDNSFKVSLGNISDYYTIKYRTDIIDPKLTLTNEAELYGEGLEGDGIGIGPDLGTIKTGELGPSNTVNNSYTKSTVNNETIDGVFYDGLNHTYKTMSWKITVNAIKEKVTELTITDTFTPANSMVFLSDSLKVVRKGSPDVVLTDEDYTLTDNKAAGFVLEFKGSHKPLERARYDIYYKTSFDPDVVLEEGGTLNSTNNYKNTVTFTGTTKDVANNEKAINTSDTKEYNINQVVSQGGKKDGFLDRPNRKIEWKVYANALGQDLRGAPFIITDTISPTKSSDPDGKSGHEFDQTSFVVRTYSLKEDGTIVLGAEISGYDLNYTDDNKFTITFENGIDVPVMVQYTTNITGISKAKYYNVAVITGKDDLNKTYSDDVDYDKHGEFISKEASSVKNNQVFTDDEIEWTLKINESLSEINAGATLTDEMSEGLVYLNDSLEINSSKGTLVEGTDYTFSLVDKTLNITFINEITEMYIITYKTAVTAAKGIKVKNNATFNGESGSVVDDSKKDFTVMQFSGGTGTGVTRGSIKIVKSDAEDENTKLKDAEFEIYYMLNGTIKQIVKDSNNNNTHKTNSNGVIELKGLVLGRTYFIKEVKSPNGYVLDSRAEEEVTLIIGNKDVELPFTNTKVGSAKGNIKFTKKGEGQDGNALKGAEFKLYSKLDLNSAIQTSVSGDDGIVEFKDVLVGEYIIKETRVPTGYVAHEDIQVKVEVTENGQTIELSDVINKIVKGNIEISKVDEDDRLLPGANFGLYTKLDVDFENLIKAEKSDANGKVLFEDVPYGDYNIREITAPEGYAPSKEVIFVSIKDDGVTVKPSENPIVNKKVIGDVEVIKFGEDNNITLKGAKFALIQNDEIKYQGETDGQGRYVFNGVVFGTYILKEISAPEGYNLTNQEEVVEIKEQGQELIIKKFENTKIRGSVKLKKLGEDGEGLQGAEFSIYKSTDVEFTTPISTATSDINGDVVFTNVEYGKYNIKETKAPEGYNLSDKVIENVEITTEGEEVIPTDNEISNTKIRGSIEILKRNRNTHRPLANAKIGLYTEEGILIGEKFTGIDGKVVFEGLEYGRYYFKETKAPSGYILDNTKYYFDIEDNDVMLERQLDNRRIPTEPEPIDPDPTDPDPPVRPPVKPEPEKPVDPEKPTEPTEPVDPTEPVEITEVPEPEEPEIPIVITPPKGGNVEFDEDGNWKYTPNPGFTGKDSFVLKHPDGTEELIEIDVDAPLGGTDADEKAPTLPKTGQVGSILIYIAGLFFIVVGIVLRRRTV
jgi:LPXTG-motif cell wall-anchored protein